MGLLRLFLVGLFGADFALLFAWSLCSGDCATSGLPHWPQKRAKGTFSPPQLAQRSWKGSPHPIQNFMPSGVSKPQLAQRMLPLYSFGRSRARKTSAPLPSGGNLLSRARGPYFPTFNGTILGYNCPPSVSGRFASRSLPDTLSASSLCVL